MMQELNTVIGLTTVVTSLIAGLMAYVADRKLFNALMLWFYTTVACGLCFLGIQLAGWPGLMVAIGLVTVLAYRMGKGFGKKKEDLAGKRRGGIFVPALWLGFCGSFAIGYWAGGPLGLFTITVPSLVIFWVGLFAISGHLLPLRNHGQWSKAFRSLFSFSLGTNYPYYVLEDREIVERVMGNAFGQFFAGPGIILTDAAHAPVVWEGLKFKAVGEPGLTFSDRFDQMYQTVDLRPQLRSFYVDAITKDGIRIQVLTFVPFRLNTEGQEPKRNGGFPLDKQRIYKTVWEQPVEEGQKRSWDEVVQIVATRILRRIIGQYRCDELCESFDPGKDPRVTIKDELVKQLRRELRGYEIELLGGGISNLEPVDMDISSERIAAWRAEWERRITDTLAEARANSIWQVEQAYAQAQAGLIGAVHSVVQQQQELTPEILSKLAALRFVEALEDMACSPQVRQELPPDTAETLGYLRRMIS